jgi:predicted RecA/RadA family phage recombinase
MKNYAAKGERITFLGSALLGPNNPIKSGDPVFIGRIVGVANADQTPGSAGPANDSNVVVQLIGVFNLAVQSLHHALVAGETVYINTTTGQLNDDSTQMPFGSALDPVTQYALTTIRVRLFGATAGLLGATTYES